MKGNAEEMSVHLLEIKPKILVICASDKYYPELLPELVPLLKGKVKDMVLILTGNPGDKKKEFENIGIDSFIYHGADTVSILEQILERTGVTNG